MTAMTTDRPRVVRWTVTDLMLNLIQTAAADRGWAAKGIAGGVGIPKSTAHRVLHGHNRDIDADTIRRIVKALDLGDPETFIGLRHETVLVPLTLENLETLAATLNRVARKGLLKRYSHRDAAHLLRTLAGRA